MTQNSYDKLVARLIEWAYQYYVLDTPIATDEEYDKLYIEVMSAETRKDIKNNINSPTQKVGGVTIDSFVKATHPSKMYSMEDYFSTETLKVWMRKFNGTFLATPKLDGASLNLVYSNGKLVKAITRGTGEVGEDVTNNAKAIQTIPLTIDSTDEIEVRGEVCVTKEMFSRINDERSKLGLQLYANPRNLAAGTIRQLDNTIVAKRKLVFIPHGVGSKDLKSKKFCLLTCMFKFFRDNKFKAIPFLRYVDTGNIDDLNTEIINLRDELPIMIDGMVISLTSATDMLKHGFVGKYPKFMVALKFPAVEKSTKILEVVYQVGRTGVITPVLELEPVEIDGSVVRRVTMHNVDELEKSGVRIGDSIIIIKSGDIIPKLTAVLKDRRDGTEKIIPRITNCPDCKEKLSYVSPEMICTNKNCLGRRLRVLSHFVSREAMNIEDLSTKTLRLLLLTGLVTRPVDIFKLTMIDLENLPGFKERKATKLMANIRKSLNPQLDKFIYSFGVPNIGKTFSKLLARKYNKSLTEMVSKDELMRNPGIGESLADAYVDFYNDDRDYIDEMLTFVNPIVALKNLSNEFTGKRVVITGTLLNPRSDIVKWIEDSGGSVGSSVSKTTDILIAGSGDKKSTKELAADKLGITVMKDFEIPEGGKE